MREKIQIEANIHSHVIWSIKRSVYCPVFGITDIYFCTGDVSFYKFVKQKKKLFAEFKLNETSNFICQQYPL